MSTGQLVGGPLEIGGQSREWRRVPAELEPSKINTLEVKSLGLKNTARLFFSLKPLKTLEFTKHLQHY